MNQWILLRFSLLSACLRRLLRHHAQSPPALFHGQTITEILPVSRPHVSRHHHQLSLSISTSVTAVINTQRGGAPESYFIILIRACSYVQKPPSLSPRSISRPYLICAVPRNSIYLGRNAAQEKLGLPLATYGIALVDQGCSLTLVEPLAAAAYILRKLQASLHGTELLAARSNAAPLDRTQRQGRHLARKGVCYCRRPWCRRGERLDVVWPPCTARV